MNSVITETQISMEQNNMRKFYETVNDVQRKTTQPHVMTHDRVGNLLTIKLPFYA